jgi:hypothetical protein
MGSYTDHLDVRPLTDTELGEVGGALLCIPGEGTCPRRGPVSAVTSPDLVGLLQFLLQPLL